MMRAKEEHIKAISSLQGNPGFYKFMELLKEEQQFCITGLMTAKADNVAQLQGRTKLLTELITLIEK